MQSRRTLTLFVVALLMCGPSAISAASLKTSRLTQNKPVDIAGKYEGVAKSQAIGEIPLKVEIKNEGGKLSGKIDTSQGALAITGGTYADGKIVMKFDAGGTEGTVTAKPVGDNIVGEWEMGGQTGTIELKKVGTMAAATATPAPTTAPPSAGVGGDWIASADVEGQALEFSMKLKQEGQAVTGETTSAMGTGTLKGTFAGDKLSFVLDAGGTAITMNAVLKDGKLTGEYEVPGQAKGKWEAKKK